jgi:hypothetical protein
MGPTEPEVEGQSTASVVKGERPMSGRFMVAMEFARGRYPYAVEVWPVQFCGC